MFGSVERVYPLIEAVAGIIVFPGFVASKK